MARTQQPAPPPADMQLPSRAARLSGLAIAVITGILAGVLAVDAAGAGTTFDAAVRSVVAAALLALALFVAALVAFPRQIRDFLQRRYERGQTKGQR